MRRGEDAEHCRMSLYVSDVRLLVRRFMLVAQGIERVWAEAHAVVRTA
jgi:hypothetical protein